jgi:hypothetical protein
VLTLTLEDIDKLLDKKLTNLHSATNQSKEQILDEFLNELAKLQSLNIKQLKSKSGNPSNADKIFHAVIILRKKYGLE